jgi:uncharacterized membrane-anchored protein
MPEINYLAELVSGVVAMVIGALWYGPLFGNAWMRGQGLDPNNKEQVAKMKKAAGPAYLQMFIGALLQMFVFAHVIWAFLTVAVQDSGSVNTINMGLQGGFWMWLGFVLPIKYGDKLWGNKAFKYVAVDLGYYLVLLLITGVILAAWR